MQETALDKFYQQLQPSLLMQLTNDRDGQCQCPGQMSCATAASVLDDEMQSTATNLPVLSRINERGEMVIVCSEMFTTRERARKRRCPLHDTHRRTARFVPPLTKSSGQRLVVDHVNLEVSTSKIFGLSARLVWVNRRLSRCPPQGASWWPAAT